MSFLNKNYFLEIFTLGFYLTVWFINPSNKIALLLSVIFLVILLFKLKSLELSSLIMFLLTSILPMGKKYFITLHDLKEFTLLKELYPIGLVETVTITIADVLFAVFIIAILINLVHNRFKQLKNIKLNLLDVLLIIFIIYGIFADLISSKQPFFSLLFKIGLFESAVVYFALKHYLKQVKNLSYYIFTIFAALLFFESFLAIQQFIISAPLGKNFEPNFGIETFGNTADELTFTFRPTGTFSHANYLGLSSASLLPLLLYFLVFKKERSPIFSYSFFLGLISLLITLSRSAWVGFFTAITYLLYNYEHKLKINLVNLIGGKRILIFVLFFLPIGFYTMPRIAKSIYSTEQSGGLNLRVRQVAESAELLATSPLTGVGTGMSVVELIERNKQGVFGGFPSSVHNYYALLALENGLPQLMLLILIIIYAVKKFITLNTPIGFACISSIIVLVIGAMFQPSFDYKLFFVLLGLNFAKIGDGAKTI